jgi:cytochrome P450
MQGESGSDLSAVRSAAYSCPIDELNITDLDLWRTGTFWPYFERLRDEDPVHLHPAGQHRDGPFWSVTRFEDIVAVDTNTRAFSSEGSITIDDPLEALPLPMFIAMDPPKHDEQRKTVQPIVSPTNLLAMETLIRSRVSKTLDELPIGEPFDWVDRVSIELTGQMLATLFDFPFEDRRKLTYWSDMSTAEPDSGVWEEGRYEEQFAEVMGECAAYFGNLWEERASQPPKGDLISLLAHGSTTREMSPEEFLGNIILLIVGGNDTTRNSMSGSVLALHQNPDQRKLLNNNPNLIPSMVAETIRWQTPLAYMRRTATQDVELGGKTIKQGDKVLMWYISGNRDGTVIDKPDEFIINREQPRRHLSFGFGIHRCMGNRLAELQLAILWEEILTRFPEINVLDYERVPSSFVHGYSSMQVIIPRRL